MVHALQAALGTTIRKNSGPSLAPRRPTGNAVPSPRLPPLKFGNVGLLDEILSHARAHGESIGFNMTKGRHDRSFTAPPSVFKALLAEHPTDPPYARRSMHYVI